MSYVQAIFENSEMANYVNGLNSEVESIVNENINVLFSENFKYVVENVDKFLGNTVLETFNNIKAFAMGDAVNLLNAIGEAYSMEEDASYINEIMEDDTTFVFTGVGYGTQKAQQIIEALYEEESDESANEE